MTSTNFRGLNSLLRVVLAAGVLSASTALAETRPFDVPTQSAATGIPEFARQANVQILASEAVIRGKRTNAVQGLYSIDEALKKLLDGMGLRIEVMNDDTIVVRPAAVGVEAQLDPVKSLLHLARMDAEMQSGTDKEVDKARKETKQDQDMVVTGTNIRGAAPAGSPVMVLDREAIRRSGYTSTEQLIHSLPQNVRSGAEGATADADFSTGSLRGVNSTKGSGVNLRGLGSVATLVLINGRRIAASTAGTFTDISLIPLNAIERIEILTDGASAIYGADAVAGVVNFILRSDYEGSESQARYGFTTEKGREEFRLTHSVGSNWGNGNALVVLDYLKQSELRASDRDFASTDAVGPAATIFPRNEQLSFVLSGTQTFGQRWSAQTDVQYARSKRFSQWGVGVFVLEFPLEIDRINAAASLSYQPFSNWEITFDALASQEDIEFSVLRITDGVPNVTGSSFQHQVQDLWSAGIKAAGTVLELPAGHVALAVGAAHRVENYVREEPLRSVNLPAQREVDSAFAELHISPFSKGSAAAGLRSLKLSLAGRYDDYSDFGETFNPKFGISWFPLASLELRSSYSTSFRAPSAGRELVDSIQGTARSMYIYSLLSPDGMGTVPAVNLFGSTNLRAEESDNWTAGFTYKPQFVEGLKVGFTYYDIAYTDRIVAPNFSLGALSDPALQTFVKSFATSGELQAAIEQIAGGPVTYVDVTGPNYAGGAFGPNPENVATYYYDTRWTNAGTVKISGLDFTVDYALNRGAHHFNFGFNANYINEIETLFSPGSMRIDLVDTTGNPADLRMRASCNWAYRDLDGNLAVNYTDAYTDNTGAINRSVEAFTTIDATLRYAVGNSATALRNMFLSLSVINLLDEPPPFIAYSGRGSNYDSANATPLGRMVSFDISRRW